MTWRGRVASSHVYSFLGKQVVQLNVRCVETRLQPFGFDSRCDDIRGKQRKEAAVVTWFDKLRFCGTPPCVIVEALDVHIGLDIISSWFDIFWDYLSS